VPGGWLAAQPTPARPASGEEEGATKPFVVALLVAGSGARVMEYRALESPM